MNYLNLFNSQLQPIIIQYNKNDVIIFHIYITITTTTNSDFNFNGIIIFI
jgi:hypothetical protein